MMATTKHPMLETGCARCGNDLSVSLMSRFNTDVLCMNCEALEREHPAFAAAEETELLAVRSADYNFRGVGLPAGYSNWASQQRRER